MAPARGSSAWRSQVWGPGCSAADIVPALWIISSGGKLQVHRRAVQAVRALGRVLHLHRYAVRRDVTGAYNCRKITGGNTLSSHAYGVSVDINWDTNPYRTDRLVTDMPRAMIEACEAITTRAGVRVWRWGGDWDGRPETPHSNYDAMHFEIIATPEELRAGFDVPYIAPDRQETWPLLAEGERGPGVLQLQRRLALDIPELVADGIFGPKTTAIVQQWQTLRGLPADGIVGLGTWTAIFTRQPLAGSCPAPTKGQ